MIVELARRVSSCGWVALCARRRAGFARLSSWQPVGNWVALAANFGHKGAVTIDLRQMGKVKEVDKTSRAALIEGGTYMWHRLPTASGATTSRPALPRSDSASRRVTSSGRGRGPRQRQLFEPGNEANSERGERGDNAGEQLLLSQPPPRRLLLLLVPDRTGLALFDLPDAQTFELTAPGAPLSPSCHLASHLLGLPVPQKLFSGQLAAVGRMTVAGAAPWWTRGLSFGARGASTARAGIAFQMLNLGRERSSRTVSLTAPDVGGTALVPERLASSEPCLPAEMDQWLRHLRCQSNRFRTVRADLRSKGESARRRRSRQGAPPMMSREWEQ
jgi:hypothetical protein